MFRGRIPLAWLVAFSACGRHEVSPQEVQSPSRANLTANACTAPAFPDTASLPLRYVGDGTAASCTLAALQSAVAQGGRIRFRCGTSPFTFLLNETLNLPTSTATDIDGEGRIVLDGANRVRILRLNSWYDQTAPNIVIRNLTFQNGRSSGTAHSGGLGTNWDGGGAAIYHLGGSLFVENSTFLNNSGPSEGPDLAGGAIFGAGYGRTVALKSTFRGNKMANGGAIGSLGNAVEVIDSLLEQNEATGYGANSVDSSGTQIGRGGNGGAIVHDGVPGGILRICGTTIRNNTFGAFGGGVFRTAYKAPQETQISASVIDGNRVRAGITQTSGAGGLYLQGGPIVIADTVISNNVSPFVGGMTVFNHGGFLSSLQLNRVRIEGNTTTGWGAGALWLEHTGGGSASELTVANNNSPNSRINVHGIHLLSSVTNSGFYNQGNCDSTARGSGSRQWPQGGTACVDGVVYAPPPTSTPTPTPTSTPTPTATPAPVPTATPTPVPNRGYQIKGLGKCLDALGQGTANATQIIINSCSTATSQRYDFNTKGELRPRHAPGKCVDVSGASTASGAKIQLWNCNGTIAQKWTYTTAGQFKGPGGKCLDITASGTASGTKVQLYDCNGTSAQKWTLVP